MINNANFDLGGKLFAYVQHGVDISESIKQEYNTSLIFIGDEQQIYVPIKNTYVGIGLTAYNQTINSIHELEFELAELKTASRSVSVQKIYPQFSPYNNNTYNVSTGDSTGTLIPGTNFTYLTGEIEISSVGDYDARTGFAYTYYLVPRNGSTHAIKDNKWHNEKTNATSGIRISYESEFRDEYDILTGISYKAPVKQRLIIDDTQTWSYMTYAYAYALDFSREFTMMQIENLYHNILGVSEAVMVPISDSSLFSDVPGVGLVWTNKANLYWKKNDLAPMSFYQDRNSFAVPDDWGTYTVAEQYNPDLAAAESDEWNYTLGGDLKDPDSTGHVHPRFYVLNKVYNGTYNTNISDGIQTLKEVAYILDKLSDGSLGTTTYISQSQWDDVTSHSTVYTYTKDPVEVGGEAITYYRILIDGVPTTNPNIYAYYVTKSNAENLGIQIAYSIAGNNAEIKELHNHVYLEESGTTTLRSIAAEATDMVTVSMFTNNTFTPTENITTTNQIPSVSGGRQSYTVGDTRFIIDLDLASTYIHRSLTSGGEIPTNNITVNGVSFLGLRQKADISELAGRPLPADTYYLSGDSTVAQSGTLGSLDQVLNTNLYYQGKSASYAFINNKFKKVYSSDELANLITNGDTIYVQDTDVNSVTKGQFFKPAVSAIEWREDSNHECTYAYYYCTNEADVPEYITHAILDETNKIATTAWTLALLNDHSGDISDDLEDTLQKAYNYTNHAIDVLDFRMSYSDFNVTLALNSNIPNLEWDYDLPEGTAAYERQYLAAREAWNNYITSNNTIISGDFLNAWGTYAYLSNKIRSQYISNIVEENGIVKVTETKELPTDQISISTSIWGNQDANFAKLYSEIEFDTSEGAPSEIKQLFAKAKNAEDHQLYYKDGIGETYRKIQPSEVTGGGTYYIYNSNTGQYSLANQLQRAHFITYNETTSAVWEQLYVKTLAYYEVDLASIEVYENGATTYIKGFYYNKYDENGNMTNATFSHTPTLYTVQPISSTSYSTKYVSGKVYHYNYENQGGEGQNRLDITTHITHIEDASPMNTGLADAWDVASFISNLCEWVDLSASVTEDMMTRPAFYSLYTPWGNSTPTYLEGGHTAPVDVYRKTGNTYTLESNAKYNAFKYNGSTIVIATSEDGNDDTKFWSFAVNGLPNQTFVGYYCSQPQGINPLNLTLTKFGAQSTNP